MSSESNRRGCGCYLAGCAVLVVAAGVLGFVLGLGAYNMQRGPGVAVLDITGEIIDSLPVLDRLDQLAQNPDTRALVIRVDSPGGAITAVEEIYNGLKRTAERDIPVVASMGSTGASGGYFVCLAADRIFVNQSSLTGSIGVLVEYSSAHDLFEKLGIKFDTITSGEFKGMGSVSESLTEPQRNLMQGVVKDFHAFFVETLMAARHLGPEQALQLADGRVFTGRQALQAGLVDEIGDLDSAIRYAANRAGIEGEPRVIRSAPEPWSLLDEWLGRLGTSVGIRLGRSMCVPKFVMR